MAQTFGINRQPDKLDYSSPTQFKFNIVQLPKVEFFTTEVNLPGITLGDAIFPTPFTDIPVMGDKLTFDNLTVSFIVDEFLENYISIHEWMTSIGFPKSREQFSNFRSVTSNTPTASRGVGQDIGAVTASTAVRSMFSDATLTILTNKNNPIVEVRFAFVVIKENSRTSVHLINNNSLHTIGNKSTAVCHHRNFAHVNFLFFS